MQPRLRTISAGNGKVRMPCYRHRFCFAADILSGNRRFNCLPGESDTDRQISLRRPISAEISRVDHPGDSRAIRRSLDLHRVGLTIENQPVDRMELCIRVGLSLPNGGQGDGFSIPLGSDILAIRRELSPTAVWVGDKESAPECKALHPMHIVRSAVQLTGCFFERRCRQNLDFPFPWQIGSDLEYI